MNRHRNLSFNIESLVLLFFLLAALVVLIRMFGAAQALGMQARQKTDATLILQTVSADFSAQADPFDEAVAEAAENGRAQVEFLCDGQGRVSQDGVYRVQADLWSEAREAGSMIFAELRVTRAADTRNLSLGELETFLYYPQLTQEVQP